MEEKRRAKEEASNPDEDTLIESNVSELDSTIGKNLESGNSMEGDEESYRNFIYIGMGSALVILLLLGVKYLQNKLKQPPN